MFKKPKRNFRGRQRDSESDDDAAAQSAKDEGKTKPTASTSAAAAAPLTNADPTPRATALAKDSQSKKIEKPVQTVASAAAIVSFEHDDEGDGEVFQIKKPTHSKRIVRQIKKESLKEKLEPDIKSEAEHFNGNNSSAVKSEVKKEVIVKSDVDDDFDDDDDDDDGCSGSHNSGNVPSMQDILRSGQIPDANTIHLIRKKRQLAREQGDEFIPIDDTVRFENKSSRLIRDDDNDASDTDEENLAITSQQKASSRRQLEERILAAEEESHSDASEQALEWEEQQIRKGVSIPAQPAPTFGIGGTNNGANYLYNQLQPYIYSSQAPASVPTMISYGMESMVTAGGLRFPNMSQDSEPISLEKSKEKLSKRLTDMLDRHRLNVHDRDEMSSRRELNQDSIRHLSGKTRGLEEQFKFFQEMRGYVKDLVECMNEKMSSINFLDRCMMDLWKERSKKLIKRHQEDVKDQSLEYTAGKGGLSVPLVDKGGPGDQARNQRRADREGRRNRRKLAREAKGIRDHCDGMSTDDEFSISEAKKYKSELDRLAENSSTALDDVMDDFCEYSLIKRRFELWKSDYSDSYNEAYIGLCLTKLFTPLVRLELISWNPLEPNCVDFERSRWFNSLIFYGYKKGSSGSTVDEDDPDVKLVPNVVEKVLLPHLKTLVESVWNPLSLQETKRLVVVIRRLVENYPTVNAVSKNTQALIKSVVERIKKALDDDVFMPLYPKQVVENRASGPSAFFHRQFWLCVKLLKSIVLWNGILSRRLVQQLSFDSLLNRYIIIAIPSIPFTPEFVSMCQAIATLIPKDWFSDCKGGATLPQLENFCRCLVNSAASSSSNADSRDLVRQIGKILSSIQAVDHVASLSSRVNFKIVD